MRKNKILEFGLWAVGLLTACLFLLFCEKGDQPVGPVDKADTIPGMALPSGLDTVTWQNGQMHLIVEPSRLLAAYGDTAQVTVVAYDNYHNPISDKRVTFVANTGLIFPAEGRTDASGRATAQFISVPVNMDAIIYAYLYLTADSVVCETHNITLSGLQVNIRPAAYNVLVGNVVNVVFEVVDAAGKPLANDLLFISGSILDTLMTLGNGTALLDVTRATQGDVLLNVRSALGAQDTAAVHFWVTLPDTLVEQQDQIRQMRIYSSRSQLNADNTDYASITVILINENNNPAVGDTVLFSSDLGVVGAWAVVDSTGRATVRLQSAPINGVCTIRAVAASTKDTVSTQVLFGGISLALTSDPAYLKIGAYSTIEALLRNASNMPIGGDIVTFTVSGGAVFETGTTFEKVVLNPEGKAQIRLTAAAACSALIYATTLNTRDSTTVIFTNNALTLTAARSGILVGGADSTLVTAHYVNGSNAPVAGVPIRFATNAGTVRETWDTTDAQGNAATVLFSADFAATATVEAVARDARATETVVFMAAPPASIVLTVTPDNIKVNGGVATIIATVTDAQGNRVSGADINFKIIEGPGGGEYIEKPLVTAKDGDARTRIFSGAEMSQLLGTKIGAYYGQSVSATTKLTISGRPFAVSVARPQTDTIRVDDAGQIDSAVFDYFMGAVVKDINGNPVADGTEVHFSAVVAGMAVYLKTFHHWETPLNGPPIPYYAYRALMVPFEDLNNNFQMDPGVDLTLDFNDAVASRGDDVDGDGVCDFDPALYDFWWDFNGNLRCDPGVAEPVYVDGMGDTSYSIFADLNGNGFRDTSELLTDHDTDNVCDLPSSGDFRFSLWEGFTNIFSRNFRFQDNNFGVVIDNSGVTKGGVAYARLTYPRQFARKLYVLVNAEVDGVRDIHSEPFVLVIILKS